MRALPRRRTASPAPAPDAGFTLVETMVAIGIIGVVMMALTTFFVSSMRASTKQSGTQAAVQVASDAMERVRSLAATTLDASRDQTSANNQWASPVPGVAPWLTSMTIAYDAAAAAGTGATAPMPTSPATVTLGGVAYKQNFYLGTCWQNGDNGGTCMKTKPADPVEFFRVVVAVTWPGPGCTAGVCSYVTTSLFSNAEQEPSFDSDDQAIPPEITVPDDQIDDVGTTVSLQMEASGGAAPLNWISANGLPPGLSMTTSGLIAGRLSAAPGSYTVSVSLQDGYDLVNTASFAWTVTALPVAQKPADQTTQGGLAITAVTLKANGGTTPVTWAATNIPPGLTLNTSTGVITGTPTKVGVSSVVATVTDRNGNTSPTTFAWTVPALTVTAPTSSPPVYNVTMAPVTVVAAGGIRPYTWSATGLPAGITINSSTGVISGRTTARNTYSIVVTVRDSQLLPQNSATASFTWKVQ